MFIEGKIVNENSNLYILENCMMTEKWLDLKQSINISFYI